MTSLEVPKEGKTAVFLRPQQGSRCKFYLSGRLDLICRTIRLDKQEAIAAWNGRERPICEPFEFD